jgi:hypothetical protein
MITRRQSLKRLLGVAAVTITAPTISRGWFQLFADSATKYSARAIELVHRAIIVDMLNPFTLLGVLAPFKGDTELVLGGTFRRVLGQIWTA